MTGVTGRATGVGHYISCSFAADATSRRDCSLRTALKLNAAIALTSIGVVTLLFSAAGAAFGRFLGERFGRAIEVAGGTGLIAIGVQIVVEHAGR